MVSWRKWQSATAAAIVLLSGPAVVAAQDAATTCQRAISRASGAYVQGRARVLAQCQRGKIQGDIRASDPCSGDPTTQNRLEKLWVKLFAEINRRCGGPNRDCGDADDLPLASTGWGNVPACPNFESLGCTNPVANCSDISTCLQCVDAVAVDQSVEAYAGQFNTAEFGTSSAANRCQLAINKGASKFLEARSKALQACLDARLRGSHANPCPDPGDGKTVKLIEKAEAKKISTICRACGGPDGLCNGVGDLTPAEIGYASRCPAVSPVGGGSCDAAIADMQDVVDCIDCLAAFKTDCTAAVAVPQVITPYPATCNAGPTTTTTTSTTTTTTTTTSSTSSTTSTSSSTTVTSTSSTSTTISSTTTLPSTTTTTTTPSSTTTTTVPSGVVCGAGGVSARIVVPYNQIGAPALSGIRLNVGFPSSLTIPTFPGTSFVDSSRLTDLTGVNGSLLAQLAAGPKLDLVYIVAGTTFPPGNLASALFSCEVGTPVSLSQFTCLVTGASDRVGNEVPNPGAIPCSVAELTVP